jgi:phage-related minor tail protein
LGNLFQGAGGAGGILSSIGGFFGFAHGGVSTGLNSASNSIISSPTYFPNASPVKGFANGGVAIGEADRQEAVLPLERIGKDLGVRAIASTPNFNVSIVNKQSDNVKVDTTEPVINDDGSYTIGVIIDAIQRDRNGLGSIIQRRANMR